MNEAGLLIFTAASIAALHTILGPDHYLPFTAMGKARNWSLAKTLRITFYCGLGHVFGSIVLGVVGLLLGAQLASLVAIEGIRGNLASWALIALGLMYFAWGLKKAGRGHSHSHLHSHGEHVHSHEHDHSEDHAHVHTEGARAPMAAWSLFIVFVLGPCEALIPLLMYPAAKQSTALLIAVACVFGAVTLITMLCGVYLTTRGIEKLRLPNIDRYAHAVAGASIVACGSAIAFLGL